MALNGPVTRQWSFQRAATDASVTRPVPRVKAASNPMRMVCTSAAAAANTTMNSAT